MTIHDVLEMQKFKVLYIK